MDTDSDTDTDTDERSWTYKVDLKTGGTQAVSEAVIETVAYLTGTNETEIPPLWKYVNPEALDAILDHGDDPGTECRVTFPYLGYVIECIGTEELRLTPVGEADMEDKVDAENLVDAEDADDVVYSKGREDVV